MIDGVDNEDQLIRRYLLGGLTPQQREQVETRVFTDGRYREKVELIEAGLIDDYADDALAPDERDAFARHFLANPHRRLDVHIVEELNRHAAARAATAPEQSASPDDDDDDDGPPVFVPAPSTHGGWYAALHRHRAPLFATFLVLLAAGAALVILPLLESRGLEQRLLYEHSPRADLEREVARLNSPRNEEDERAASEARAATSSRLELAPGIQRAEPEGAVFPSLDVTGPAAFARLRLRLESAADGYQTFRALFKMVDGDEQFEADLTPSVEDGRRVVGVTLPLAALHGGDYQIQLYGRAASGHLKELPDHYYYLSIVRRPR